MFVVFVLLFTALLASGMDDRCGQKKVVQFVEKRGKRQKIFYNGKVWRCFQIKRIFWKRYVDRK